MSLPRVPPATVPLAERCTAPAVGWTRNPLCTNHMKMEHPGPSLGGGGGGAEIFTFWCYEDCKSSSNPHICSCRTKTAILVIIWCQPCTTGPGVQLSSAKRFGSYGIPVRQICNLLALAGVQGLDFLPGQLGLKRQKKPNPKNFSDLQAILGKTVVDLILLYIDCGHKPNSGP